MVLHFCRWKNFYPTLIGFLLSSKAVAQTCPLTAKYDFIDKDTLSEVLFQLNVRPVYGANGQVADIFKRYPLLEKAEGRKIKVGTTIEITVKKCPLPSDWKIKNGYFVNESNGHSTSKLSAKEIAAREAAEKTRLKKEKAMREQAVREQAAKEQAAREQEAKERIAKEQAAREQAAKEQATREQAERERAAKEQALKEEAAKEVAQRELTAKLLKYEMFFEDSPVLNETVEEVVTATIDINGKFIWNVAVAKHVESEFAKLQQGEKTPEPF